MRITFGDDADSTLKKSTFRLSYLQKQSLLLGTPNTPEYRIKARIVDSKLMITLDHYHWARWNTSFDHAQCHEYYMILNDTLFVSRHEGLEVWNYKQLS